MAEHQVWEQRIPGSDVPAQSLHLHVDDQGRATVHEAVLAQLLVDAGWERADDAAGGEPVCPRCGRVPAHDPEAVFVAEERRVCDYPAGHGYTPSDGPFGGEGCRVMLARYPCNYSREEHDPALPQEDLDVFGYRRGRFVTDPHAHRAHDRHEPEGDLL